VVTRLDKEPEAELYELLTTANEAEAVVKVLPVDSLFVTLVENEAEVGL
jgi:hypothetical protein